MSTEKSGKASKKAATPRTNPTVKTSEKPHTGTSNYPATPKLADEQEIPDHDKKSPAKRDQASDSTTPTTPEDPSRPRQVIAVSASKGPAAFFNLARKFLVTDDMCDLSALEGAIVSAVDAAHLLERSKLATIVRVQTSYVSVEPKKRKSHQEALHGQTEAGSPSAASASQPSTPVSKTRQGDRSSGRELRRARIVITVKRTESYKQWLQENPLQAIIAGDEGDDDDDEDAPDQDVTHQDMQRR